MKMAEASEVRLVRCPKCENVLTVLPAYSVYRCGGCGAVLLGTYKAEGGGDIFYKSNSQGSRGVYEKRGIDTVTASEMKRRERAFQERSGANLTTNSSSRINKEEIKGSGSDNTAELANSSFTNELGENRHPTGRSTNYSYGSVYGYCEPVINFDSFNGQTTVENLENDRAELLRNLHELTNQLSRSCDTIEKPNERFNADDRRMASDRGKHVSHQIPSFQGQVSIEKNHALRAVKYYHNLHTYATEYIGYEDPYCPQIPSRQTYQSPPPPLYVASNPHETFFHQSECSCLHCYNKNQQIPPKAPPPVFTSQRSRVDPMYPLYYNHVNPITDGPLYHNSQGFQTQPRLRQQHDFESENGSIAFGPSDYRHQRREAVYTQESNWIYLPIACGAPFIICCNCFGLLKLRRKIMPMGTKQRQIECGACSAILLIEIENKNILVSVSAQIKQDSNIEPTSSYPDEVDQSGYNFQLTDTETDLLPRDRRPNSSETEKKQEPHSSSSSYSKNEHSPSNVIVQKDDVSLSPKECADSSSDDGNKSKQMDQNKRQSSVEDAMLATEMELSTSECFNSSRASHDSVEMRKEEDRPHVNKGNESFFAGIVKRSFGDLSRSNQSMENHESNVFVNGKHIADHLVEKAEKLAGPIQPGEYWYDSRAGFWGLMGQPCLGIIPPRIKEFNHPMPENCGGGNTGVFVNGRELHQRDLDLLCGRGLPSTVNKSYVIKISGRVFDEDTGEELDSLGKLAPTVHKARRGFGMKIPKAIVPSS